MQSFISQVYSKAEEAAQRHKLKVYDVTFRRQSSGMVLRITLDGNVTLDNCADVSKALSDWLDGIDVPAARYNLEVSSLGIDRPLKSEAEFAAFIGKVCKLTVKTKGQDGRKRYKGRIIKAVDGEITLSSEEEGCKFILSIEDIAKANLTGE